MTKPTDIITFEAFTGVDLNGSELGRDENAAISMVNLEKLENGSLRGRQGIKLASQPLYTRQIFKYVYTDTDNVIQEELLGVGCANPLSAKGGQLYRLRSADFTVSYSGSDPTWEYQVFPVAVESDDIDDSYINFYLRTAGGSSDPDLNINLGSGYLPSPITLVNVSGIVDALTDFACFPDKTAIVNGAQTGAKVVTVDTGHTIDVGDWISFKDRNTALEEYREVIATTSTTITFHSNINFDWNDDDVIGHGRFPAAILSYRTSELTSESSLSVEYSYWEPIPMSTNRNDGVEDTYVFSALSLNPGKEEFLQPSGINHRNCFYLTSSYVAEHRLVTSLNEGLGENTRRIEFPHWSGVWKYDGAHFYMSGFPMRAGSGMAISTSASGTGVANGLYIYKLSFLCVDAQGNEFENFNESNNKHTVSGGPKDVDIDVTNPGANTDFDKYWYYNIRSAVANGAHSSGATITVDAGHLLRTNDWVFFHDSSGDPHRERVTAWTNTSITITTETISGSDHTLDSGQVLSTVRGRLWRTKANATEFLLNQEFEVDENAGNTIALIDDKADTDLGFSRLAIQPDNIQFNFPKGNCITVHQGSLVVAGGSRIPNEVHWEDAASPESSSRAFDNTRIPAHESGDITNVIPSDTNALVVMKGRAKYGLYGNLPGREFEILRISENGFGSLSPQGVNVYERTTFGISPLGIWGSDIDGVGKSFGSQLLPLFRNRYEYHQGKKAASSRFALNRVVCKYDEQKNWIHFVLPFENKRTEDSIDQWYLGRASKYYVFMIPQADDVSPCWSEFTYDLRQIPNGGLETVDDEFYQQTYLWDEDLNYWTGFLHKRNQQVSGDNGYDFVDHVKAYDWDLIPQWYDGGTPQQLKRWQYFTLYSLKTEYRISELEDDSSFVVRFESYRDWLFAKRDTIRSDALTFNAEDSFFDLEKELKFDTAYKAKRRTFRLSGSVFRNPPLITGYHFSILGDDYDNNRVARPSNPRTS